MLISLTNQIKKLSLTKDVAGDGNPIYISWKKVVAPPVHKQQIQDDFFGGGDVGIALTTTTV